ncbi:unnamed protein product [Rotaria socialis]|uniref:Reverse transcriptase domain-containing protein n=3 Tax=Rotaria TaxID=231623 RepID=A0A818CSK4_9BILA|nr:unnamed protein product [Rotaria socialis]CAF4723438.1 unnamed protein product [Rotaria socialis]
MSIYTKITASLPFIEVDLNLTSKQMSMFIKGLKYVIPCQSRFSRKPIEQIVNEQYQNISTIVKNCLKDHYIPITDIRAKQAFQELKCLLSELYSKSIPRKLTIRAKREYKIVRSIQQLLHCRTDIVIRRTDKSKVFYIGKAIDFERKSEEYMLKTEAYQEITNGRSPLSDILCAVQTLLENLVRQKSLTPKQRNQISPKLNQLELGHYHGLPKPHKPNTPLRPIIACINGPTTLISKFLNALLAPVFLTVVRETTFINDIDVIRKLETYVLDGLFQSTTKFIVIDVTDLYTMIPREGAILALLRFLEENSNEGKIGSLRIDSIMKLARLVLDNNCFVYNNKYYKQSRGGAMGSAFTQVLANIYMYYWEQDLIKYTTDHRGIYGRYIDDIFMATNQTAIEIEQQLKKMMNKDINIKINYEINTSVNFLDLTITNENGQLKTSIYHKPTTEPYILPFTSDHPRHIHRNIPYAALMRAARLCSNVNDFNSEQIRIDMSLLLNNYPPKLIKRQFHRFFTSNDAMSVWNNLDEALYRRLHQRLLQQPTRREKLLKNMLRDPIRSPTVLQTKVWDKSIMFPRYQYDGSTSNTFKSKFYKWWYNYYAANDSTLASVKVRLVPNIDQTLETFFIHKKPNKEILRRMESKTTANAIPGPQT